MVGVIFRAKIAAKNKRKSVMMNQVANTLPDLGGRSSPGKPVILNRNKIPMPIDHSGPICEEVDELDCDVFKLVAQRGTERKLAEVGSRKQSQIYHEPSLIGDLSSSIYSMKGLSKSINEDHLFPINIFGVENVEINKGDIPSKSWSTTSSCPIIGETTISDIWIKV